MAGWMVLTLLTCCACVYIVVRVQCSLQLLYFMTDKSTKCGVDICTYYPEVNHRLYTLHLLRRRQ